MLRGRYATPEEEEEAEDRPQYDRGAHQLHAPHPHWLRGDGGRTVRVDAGTDAVKRPPRERQKQSLIVDVDIDIDVYLYLYLYISYCCSALTHLVLLDTILFQTSGPSWSPLVPPGLSWSLLVSPGPTWSLLVSPGLSWSLLVPPGPTWSLLVPPGLSWSHLVSHGPSTLTLHPGPSSSSSSSHCVSSSPPPTTPPGQTPTVPGGQTDYWRTDILD